MAENGSFMRHLPVVALLPLLFLAFGCETAAPSTGEHSPAGGDAPVPEPSNSEARFAAMTQQAKDALGQNGLLLDHPELIAYIKGVGDKLLTEAERRAYDFDILIVEHPGTNAFAFGDGTIGIHTGLLIQISNEAQLATVLAHEIAHFVHGHPYKGYANAKGNSAFWMTLSIGTGGVASLPALIALPAGISGYSRNLEKQADLEGWERLVRAGYDGREAPKVFSLFKENLEEEGTEEPFFFSSHPNLDRRIENFQELVTNADLDWGSLRINRNEYLEHVAFLVKETIILNLESGYSKRARRLIEHEAGLRGESAATAFLRAESARRDPNSKTEEVLSLFKIATAYPDAQADAWKGHGLMAMKLDFHAEALAAFKQYLDLKPDAQDRDHIETYLEQCTQNLP
jgi:predicted Zn-dependent protease